MKRLGLTALVYDGPMARSYLGLLRCSGYRLERIVLMVQARDPGTRRPVAPWLPAKARHYLARRVQDLRMNHWPREYLRQHRAWCEPWLADLARAYGFAPEAYRLLTGRLNLADLAEHQQEILVDGMGDPLLTEWAQRLPPRSPVLFTGGGIVPAALLSVPQCRFIHVHPGVLPDIRGADGLLWSLLLRSRPGMSAFYMNPGLDTGEIIRTQDMALPPLPAEFLALDAATRYRFLYAFVDPMLRAVFLLRLLQETQGQDLFELPSHAQDEARGDTFHFMNPYLREFALERLHALCTPSPAARSAA